MSMLTAEQIQEIDDKAAFEAFKHLGGETGMSVYHGAPSFKTDAPARLAFARTVIDLALSKMAEGEGDLVSDKTDDWDTIFKASDRRKVFKNVNTRHRQAMAALRAQMQGEIDRWRERAEDEHGEVVNLAARYADAAARAERAEAAEKELAALKQQAPADREAFDAFDKSQGTLGYPYNEIAWRYWQAALAHKPQPWIPCSERMPTREDGDKDGDVLWIYTATNTILKRPWAWAKFTEASHWMPIPLLPTAPTAEKVPTPPEGFHIATEEERKCLPVGSKWRRKGQMEGTWWDVPEGADVRDFNDYACPNLVTFTNGKINPPPYGSWHRSDWTPEMLPDGWRPVMIGKCDVGEYEQSEDGRSWKDGSFPNAGCHGGQHGYFYRTRRPLPPAPEKEKEPEWVPLEACDVPPGSAVRPDLHDKQFWNLVESTTQTGVIVSWFGNEDKPNLRHFTFGQLFGGAEISRDNGKTWEPCKKIKQP